MTAVPGIVVGMRSTIHELGTILSIWAHPDDETYLAGGLMAAAVDNGQRVVCVTASAGEHGTPCPDEWPPERLGHVRRLEAAAAMAVLGVAEHQVLGLPDGGLSEHSPEGRARIAALVADVRPDTVLTFGPDGITFHPDHIAVHRWVHEVCDTLPDAPRILHAVWSAEHLAVHGDLQEELGVFMSDERPVGVPIAQLDVHVSLEGGALDRKVAALRSMFTQTAPMFDAVGPDGFARQVGQECFVDASRMSPPEKCH